MPAAKRPSSASTPRPRLTPVQQTLQEEVVDPAWLLKALLLSLVAALVCAWLAVCLLVYQGQWQLILHPAHTIDRTPASAGLTFQEIRFDAADTGQPRLTAWYLPAAAPGTALSPKYGAFTVLYLHDGSLSLSATVPALARLHAAGLNVFALEYRGFGSNDPRVHPSEARMTEDTAAAFDYLTGVRHLAPGSIVPYGTRLGASLAASLALRHPQIPAVILDNPDPDPTATAVAAQPSRFIPVRTLFHDRFEIAGPLAALTTPKLLIAGGPNSSGFTAERQADEVLFRKARSPAFTVTLTMPNQNSDYNTFLVRFLDQYLKPAVAR